MSDCEDDLYIKIDTPFGSVEIDTDADREDDDN